MIEKESSCKFGICYALQFGIHIKTSKLGVIRLLLLRMVDIFIHFFGNNILDAMVLFCPASQWGHFSRQFYFQCIFSAKSFLRERERD